MIKLSKEKNNVNKNNLLLLMLLKENRQLKLKNKVLNQKMNLYEELFLDGNLRNGDKFPEQKALDH